MSDVMLCGVMWCNVMWFDEKHKCYVVHQVSCNMMKETLIRLSSKLWFIKKSNVDVKKVDAYSSFKLLSFLFTYIWMKWYYKNEKNVLYLIWANFILSSRRLLRVNAGQPVMKISTSAGRNTWRLSSSPKYLWTLKVKKNWNKLNWIEIEFD